jgi:hypothetical protein
MAKWFLKNYYSLSILTILPVYVLIEIYDVGYMDIYSSLIILIFFVVYLWNSNRKGQYLLLHNVLKFIIVAGVFCIVLIIHPYYGMEKSSYYLSKNHFNRTFFYFTSPDAPGASEDIHRFYQGHSGK